MPRRTSLAGRFQPDSLEATGWKSIGNLDGDPFAAAIGPDVFELTTRVGRGKGRRTLTITITGTDPDTFSRDARKAGKVLTMFARSVDGEEVAGEPGDQS